MTRRRKCFDYPLTKMAGAISIVKFKNTLKKLAPGLTVVSGRNVRINGELRGCSGFVKPAFDDKDFRFVYFNTEPCMLTEPSCMFRTAKNDRDYSGGRNRWTDWNVESLVKGILELYQSDTASKKNEFDNTWHWLPSTFKYWL